MVRIALILAAALTLTGTAQAQSPTYRAVPATAIAQDSVIADGVMWRCGTAGCVATNATSLRARSASSKALPSARRRSTRIRSPSATRKPKADVFLRSPGTPTPHLPGHCGPGRASIRARCFRPTSTPTARTANDVRHADAVYPVFRRDHCRSGEAHTCGPTRRGADRNRLRPCRRCNIG